MIEGRNQEYLEGAEDRAGGRLVGRDPRTLPIADLAALGHISPIKAIRAKCIDCCCGQISEVRNCTAVNCPLWAFRMGKNVFRGKSAASTSVPAKVPDRSTF